MIFRILLQLSSVLNAAATQIGIITRALIAAGLGRASIAALLAARAATLTNAVNAVARSRVKDQITFLSNPQLIQLYDDCYEHSIHFIYGGGGQVIRVEIIKRTETVPSMEVFTKAAINSVMNSVHGAQMISTVRQEKLTAFQNLCSGLSVAVAALLLGSLSAQADECIPSSGFFTERVYGWAETNATAKLSTSGLWVLEPLQVDLKIGIGTSIENMDTQIYNEFIAWKNSLNVGQVFGEIENFGGNNVSNYWSQITNQANAWVNGLNSGQIQPSGGGISIQGRAIFINTNVIVQSGVTSRHLRVDIGHIDKQTNVPVSSAFPCDPYEYSCSPADMALKSPFRTCKGWIVINNGTPDAFGFSMGDADTSSSAPTLSSLLLPVVVNGKLIQGSSLAQAYGHFYTNEEQIAGTSPFWINQDGSIQQRFFLCGT
jgi:hypothetical protein